VVFFFQAEDGIRDWSVTGVQTCALPIWWRDGSGRRRRRRRRSSTTEPIARTFFGWAPETAQPAEQRFRWRSGPFDEPGVRVEWRSEERRVGEERRARGAARAREKEAEAA